MGMADFGVTNVVLDADKIIEPENMTPSMRLIVLTNGETAFCNTMEEYKTYLDAGLVLGANL